MWGFFSKDASAQFPYTTLQEIQFHEQKNIFKLYDGESKKGDTVSIFICDNISYLDSAKAAVKKLKTLKHPSILTYLESIETDKSVMLATERVYPLSLHLNNEIEDRGPKRDWYISWGIFQVTRGLAFLTIDANLRHGNIHSSSIFVNKAGEWKLFNLEYVNAGNQSVIPPKIISNLSRYDPPEVTKQNPIKNSWSVDMWGLGCLIWEIFNGPLASSSNLGQLGSIPKELISIYMELVAANPAKRPNPKELLKKLRKSYFKNDLIDTIVFLEELQIQEESEKSKFYGNLTAKLDNFPSNICSNNILPQLINAFEFGNAGSLILGPVFKLGKNLSSEEYQEKIVPCIIKLFSSKDRNARFKLLSQIEHFVEHLSNKVVNDQVFPQIQNGFIDQEPIIREKSVIAMIHLASKLNFNNLDEKVVMVNFAKLLRDEHASIRTNTTVCLGKISRYLHHGTRRKVLISAFAGKLKDPFPPARIAAINALAATQQYYTLDETAGNILPILCCKMTDPEKHVRDQAFKVSEGFIQKVQMYSENPSLKEEMEKEVESSNIVLSTASSWAHWAVGALGSKFYTSSSKSKLKVDETTISSSKEEKDEVISNPSSGLNIHKVIIEKSEKEEEENDWNNEDYSAVSSEDGWDNEDWGTLEEISDISQKTNDINWNEDSNWNEDFDKDKSVQSIREKEEEEKKREREIKRLSRTKEMAVKKPAKSSGPLKLATKKCDFYSH